MEKDAQIQEPPMTNLSEMRKICFLYFLNCLSCKNEETPIYFSTVCTMEEFRSTQQNILAKT